jgi:hypothetical protein
MFSLSDFLSYGPLGAAMFILLIAVAILFRVLAWAKSVFESVLERIDRNTTALVRLSERLHGGEEDDH